MTAVCRIPIQQGQPLPKVGFTIEGGYMIVHVPQDTAILDTEDLCNYPRCRQRTTTGVNMQRVQYCGEHVAYSRLMQKRNYASGQRKIGTGLCVRYGCRNPRTKNKRRSGLGRCCVEHAAEVNKKAKLAYRNRHPEEQDRE
jgi:hypothetical protein